MHDIHVTVVSLQEADDGVAEMWIGDRMVAYTHLEDDDLMIRIEPNPDGSAVILGAAALAAALAEANRLLTAF